MTGAPRIHGELLKLGIEISERTVSSLMPKQPRKPSSQTWRAFLKNHMTNTVSIDFFTVPSVNFSILFAIIILKNCSRKVIHFNITKHPTAQWTAQQIIEAFPWDTAPKYLVRDRDSIYGNYFKQRVKKYGDKRGLICTKVSLAKPIRRETNWFNTKRMPGSCNSIKRKTFA